jgi:Carboxypeptidase regulatory-like domain
MIAPLRSLGSLVSTSAGLLLVIACGKGQTAYSGEAATSKPGPAPASSAALGGATVTGEVRFLGKAPVNAPIDMSEEPKCKADYTATPREQFVVVNPNGTLSDVFVYVKSGLPPDAKYPPPSTPVVIDQKGCMYHPRVFGIMVGQPLKIENSDPLLHNIKAMGKANRPFNISQPAAGMTAERTFSAREVMLPFECNVHGWMHAFVGVLSHPFFSTTAADGRFTIKNLPPGTYTIEAWHEKYGTQTATVTVQGTETKTVDFTYPAKARPTT